MNNCICNLIVVIVIRTNSIDITYMYIYNYSNLSKGFYQFLITKIFIEVQYSGIF